MVIESLREYKINSFAFDKLRLGSIVSKYFVFELISNIHFGLIVVVVSFYSLRKSEASKYTTKYRAIK